MSEKTSVDAKIAYGQLSEFCRESADIFRNKIPSLADTFTRFADHLDRCPMTLEERIDHMMQEEGHAEVRNLANRIHLRHALRAKEIS